jgi:mycofactocin precursor
MSITPDETIALPETDAETEREQESPADTVAVARELVVEDLLVEDISIDGMCGVY